MILPLEAIRAGSRDIRTTAGRSSRRRAEEALRALFVAPDEPAPLAAEPGQHPPVRPLRVPPVVALEGRADLRERHLLPVAPVRPPRPRPVQVGHAEGPAGLVGRVEEDLI